MLRYYVIVILFAISLNYSKKEFKFCSRQNKIKTQIRGNYKNVISYDESPLLTSRKQNYIQLSGSGILFRNEIYGAYQNYLGTYCGKGKSIVIELRQAFELNTLKIMLRNGDVRTYDFIVYASDSNKETVIFDGINYYNEVAKIKFQNQFVKYFRIFNRNGNSETANINIIKIEAYFQL
ncbi:unnamed protein product [Paramecium sonneborni]|uniref:Uncharacterized protein n=1 Tax=Paramecium sonneborni TaxID=65129 RepID=A0A8S1QRZ7_9CILI|nr:unnamed protein product [Paramecium sonneborni]